MVLKVEQVGLARLLRLARPEVKNALDGALVQALLSALEAAEKDPAVRAVILCGEGPDFCAGADLKELRQIAGRSLEENRADSQQLALLFRRIHTLPKPVIAAVQGHALAGGSGLACVCDLVVAGASSRFGFTEARIGFIAAIVARFLIDRVGPGRARELLLTARRFDAAEAERLGLVDARVDDGEVLPRAMQWVTELAQCSASSLALTKRLLAELPGKDLSQALALAADRNAETRATEDCKEGIAAFLEKRKPRWVP